MKPSTMSLFEQEMHDQVAAAQDALAEAERRGDPLLVQAAANHLDSLVGLARRNGVVVDVEDTTTTLAADTAPATSPAITVAAEPLAAPAV
ncbi:MAG TPA: hypothetical protein VFT62_04585 [Mycobacteriales bacterium]|nr:hypothetical protein [Mycobacteriales bacterium]